MIISAVIGEQRAQEVLHPGRQRRQTVGQIGGDRATLIRIGEDRAQAPQDATTIVRIRQCVAQPVERLHNPHGRPPRPEQLARRCRSEGYGLLAELDRAQTRACMHDDPAGHGVAEAEIVGGRHPIDQHRRLIASRHGLDHPAVIRDGQLGRQPVGGHDKSSA